MEVLVLPSQWLFSPGQDFTILTSIINKGYSKVILNYDYIKNTRLSGPESFLEDFQMKPDMYACFMLLLGLQNAFNALEKDHGYTRDFNCEVYPLSCDSDIQAEYSPYFGLYKDAELIIADADFVLTKDIANRVLASLAYKSFHEGCIHADELVAGDDPGAVEYEITAFTSFLKGAAPQLLEYSIEKFVADRDTPHFDHAHKKRCILHAVVIREHNLVDYYKKHCDFHRGEKDDEVVLSAHATLSFTAAAKDFHLAFLRREVLVI